MIRLDPDNSIVKLCAEGMMCEGDGTDCAAKLFRQAWDEASTPSEKLIAAHYVARIQQTVPDKLKWDETALDLALNAAGETMRGALPSLYLNVAKCYEDLGEHSKALTHYELAETYCTFLDNDGYGTYTGQAIQRGKERVKRSFPDDEL